MFVHSGQLPHLLPPEAYYDPDWYEREQQAIFRNGWIPFCRVDQVSRSGDRFAGEVLGTPVVVINHDGDYVAFRNVCAHRHSLMAPDGTSHGKNLQCQIHGWEYDRCGKLAKLPDGRSFHGFKANGICLQSFRVERCGPMLFVSLSSEGPSVREHLGTFAEEFERFYSDVRHVGSWTIETPVNWKVIVENAVESYHVPMVHPNTYQDYRPEELHDHRLEPTYSRYGDLLPYQAEKGLESLGFRLYTWLLIREPSYQRFSHVHVYPQLLLYFGDIYRGFNYVEPLGPERTRLTVHSFVPSEIHGGFAGRWLQDLSMLVFLRMARKIIQEDVDRWPPVQRGLHHGSFPGVLSCREERVYGIQRFVAGKLGLPVPGLPAAGKSAADCSPASASLSSSEAPSDNIREPAADRVANPG